MEARLVEEMTVEECMHEVAQRGNIVCVNTMDSADKAIRAAEWVWEKTQEWDHWCAYPDKGDQTQDVHLDGINDDTPALDLWRLAVLVYRAKSSSGGAA